MLRSLMLAVLLVLAGCATPQRGQQAATVAVSQDTWRQVDRQIIAASKSALEQTGVYASGSMEHWRVLVYERTEAEFIPWFSSYWTQEWLAMKVGWYSASAKGAEDSSARRLAVYLQEQYRDQVLEPVAVEIDPEAIRASATDYYVRLVNQQVQVIAQRHRIPIEWINRRLHAIPAINLGPPATRNASLYEVVHTEPLNTLPAYAALIDHVNKAAATGSGPSDAVIATVAQRTSEKIEGQFATRGAAGAAAAVAGKAAGALISVGVAGVRAIIHEGERPEMEAQIRKSLSAAFDEAWFKSLKHPLSGVMAPVYYLDEEIEGNLVETELANRAVVLPQIEP
ncbi:lipoprotein, putative [Pseudomonas fluorescens Q2-87]|uniref:Lipoprotein, putative n=2 Tax=Pseudomonas fluorescens TaxID=294 RepID=J2Y3G7_PSEFQ|nr:lipoprotein, putative [Pseudomonas fluorescens Q2-87]